MRIWLAIGAILLAALGVIFQVALWSNTGDGSAPVVVQGIVNVLLGLFYFAGAAVMFWKATV